MIKEQLEKMSAFDGDILLADGFDDCVVGVTLRDDEWVGLTEQEVKDIFDMDLGVYENIEETMRQLEEKNQ
jgi:hypothetical protein